MASGCFTSDDSVREFVRELDQLAASVSSLAFFLWCLWKMRSQAYDVILTLHPKMVEIRVHLKVREVDEKNIFWQISSYH